MDNINTPKDSGQINRIPTAAAVILGIAAALLASLIPASAGGFLMIMLAVPLEGLLLIAEPSFAAFLPIPAAYAAAVAMTGDPLLSLGALLMVPGAFCLRICFAKKCSLSVTLCSLTVCFALSYAAFVALNLKIGFGTVVDGYNEIKSQMSLYITKMFEMMEKMAAEQFPDSDAFVFTDDMIYLVKKQMLMLFPALFIASCEVVAWIAEKLMRLFSRGFRCAFVAERKERVTLSVGFAVIFLISYISSTLIVGDHVFYYCAESLMLIVLPYAAIAGIHDMFGENGFFRKNARAGFKVFTVIVCVMALLSSPVMLFALFALWGSVYAIGRAISRKIIVIRADNGDDDDSDRDER